MARLDREVGRVSLMHRLWILLGVVGLLAGCSKPAVVIGPDGRKLFPLIVQTDWYAQPEHGGFYQAVAKGYYREVGLEVSIAQGGPSVSGIKLPTGRVQFGIGRGDDAIVQIARDIPVVIVAALMQHDPQALLLHKENPTNSFKELAGKSVMTVPGANWIAYVQQKYHIQFSVTPMNFGMAQFMADPNFIQQCFVTDEPFYVEKNGGHPKTLLLADSGFDPYRVIMGNADFVKAHPDITRAFVAATIRGWNDYMNGDPTLANAEIARRNLQMTPDFIAYTVKTMRTNRLIEGDPRKGEATGRLTRARLQALIDILEPMGVLDRHVTVEDVARLEFTQSP